MTCHSWLVGKYSPQLSTLVKQLKQDDANFVKTKIPNVNLNLFYLFYRILQSYTLKDKNVVRFR